MKSWRIPVIAAAVFVGVLLIAIATVVPFRSETARRKVIEILGARLDAEVELTDLRFHVFPRFRAEGHGLTIRHNGRRDVPPMIAIKEFAAEGSLFGLLRRHIALVVVDQLDIEIPPDRNRDGTPDSSGHRDTSHDLERTFIIDQLTSKEGRLTIIPSEDDDSPKVWAIHNLRMTSLGFDQAMPYVSTLDNAVPPGKIETTGSFGPWNVDDPGKTPVSGNFDFRHADLSVFKGISGILSAKGTFGGVLERLDVHGATDTPDFTVQAGGHPMALHATYHAIVDGTNGNTLLEEVDGSFLKTSLVAKGGVVKTPGVHGRTVTLDVTMDKARLEDVLRMAVKAAEPPMTGDLALSTKFVLPPGDRDVIEKLQLDGAFTIADGRFASADVQTKVNNLSQRTQGKDTDDKAAHVSSHFAGAFKLANGRLNIPHVTFDVPGAVVRLTGVYGLDSEQIDFSGTAFTAAKISEMTSGFKSLLLKPVDLLFNKKGGGSAIPITIGGTRDKPSFGLDKGRVLKKK